MSKTPDIKLLIKGIKLSDSQAFKGLFEYYQQAVFNFLYLRFGNIEAAEDILQEVFIRLWEKRRQIREQASIKSYLLTIANNLALNYIRHQKVVLKYQLQLNGNTHTENSPYTEFEQKEFNENLIHAIENLPEHPRLVFMLSRFENLSYKEISECLNISIKTVESHIGRALKLLRKALLVAA